MYEGEGEGRRDWRRADELTKRKREGETVLWSDGGKRRPRTRRRITALAHFWKKGGSTLRGEKKRKHWLRETMFPSQRALKVI